jgi:hypothetical protein
VTGQKLSKVIGSDGNPLIVFNSFGTQAVKVMRCSNEFCAPYFKR